MIERPRRRARAMLAVVLAAGILTACGSADKKAALNASLAEDALGQGQLIVARQYAQRALAERDDVSDYWQLLARIDIAIGDITGAFNAYQNVLTLDRGNVEALTTLCQIGLTSGSADQAVKYADQLALVSPGSTLPQTVRAAAALQRGDKDEATKLLGQVLAKAPADLGALMVQSRLLAADGRYAEGAAVIERSLSGPGNPNSRLDQLKLLYTKAGDRAGFARSVERLARANPTDAQRQIDYADILYDGGDAARAYAITRATLAMRPGDIAVASAILDLWLRQGSGAMPADRIVRDAAGLDLEGRADYAQYADETGQPELVPAILPDAATGAPTPANSDAKAALAFARGLRGDRTGAIAALDAIIAVDPEQPRALLARARLHPDAGGALTDARKVLADDAGNVVARLTVADLLDRRGEPQLAEATLREGLGADGGDLRLAVRLARLLAATGRKAEAATALADFARANPLSRRAATLAMRGGTPAA